MRCCCAIVATHFCICSVIYSDFRLDFPFCWREGSFYHYPLLSSYFAYLCFYSERWISYISYLIVLPAGGVLPALMVVLYSFSTFTLIITLFIGFIGAGQIGPHTFLLGGKGSCIEMFPDAGSAWVCSYTNSYPVVYSSGN